jgi:molybdenum cofactor cytidylyltransferase
MSAPAYLPIAALVLAAGRSTRMGAHKLLLPLAGQPLLSYALRAALESRADPVVLVLGHDAEAVRAALPAGRHVIVRNPRYTSGMASSVQAGLHALPARSLGTVILLGDQPRMTVALVDRLLAEAAAHPEAIVAASYGGRRGNPVYFPRALFAELLALSGDEGGRSVIAQHPELVRLLDFPPSGQDVDVDHPEEYERLRAEWTADQDPASD